MNILRVDEGVSREVKMVSNMMEFQGTLLGLEIMSYEPSVAVGRGDIRVFGFDS